MLFFICPIGLLSRSLLRTSSMWAYMAQKHRSAWLGQVLLLVLGFYWGLSSEAATPLAGPIPWIPGALWYNSEWGCWGVLILSFKSWELQDNWKEATVDLKPLIYGQSFSHIYFMMRVTKLAEQWSGTCESGDPQSRAIKGVLSEQRDKKLFGSSGCRKFTGISPNVETTNCSGRPVLHYSFMG